MISPNCAGLLNEPRGFFDPFSSNSNNSNNNSIIMSSKNDFFISQQLFEDDLPTTTLPTPPSSPDSSQALSNDDDKNRDPALEDFIRETDALEFFEGMELDLDPLLEDIMTNWSQHCQAVGEHLAGAVAAAAAGGGIGVSSSELRHDCMWSGNCDDSCKKQRTRYPSETSDIHLLTPASSPLRQCGGGGGVIAFSERSRLNSTVPDFVDPSAVMSYTPHADHSYYQTDSEQMNDFGNQITVATPAVSPTKIATAAATGTAAAAVAATAITNTTANANAWSSVEPEYLLSDTPSESDGSDSDSENCDDEEEIDVVSLSHAAPMRAHQRSLTSHTTSSQRSLLKSKNSLKTATHKQKKQKQKATVSTPAVPYLLTPVQSPQPANPAGPIEYPMPKVTSSGRIVQPTNRSAPFLEAQPQHSSRGDHHRRKRKNDHHHSSSGRSSKHASRNHGGSSRGVEIEDPNKRKEHNSMERKRRDDLRSAFQKLRDLVPEVKENPKAAKVTILSKAATFSHHLQTENKQLETQMRLEKQKQKQLVRTLEALQQQLRGGVSSSSTHSVMV